MDNFFEKIYMPSPVIFENLFISLYGNNIWRKRYKGDFRAILLEIEETRRLSHVEIEELRLLRLKNILAYAYSEIEYYRELFDGIGFSLESITNLNDLERIPPLEKETLKKYPEKFMPHDIKKKTYMVQKTSGSTGTPLEIHVDKYTYQLAMALLVDHEKGHGVNLGERRATFAGRMVQAVGNMMPPFWRFNSAENQMLFSSYHLNKETFPLYLAELNNFKPKEIIGYPSAIYSFACFVSEAGERLTFLPQVIVTNSETLFDWQRKVIENIFSCKVADYYGTSEYVVFAGQCKEFNYHISPLLGELEVVDRHSQRIFGESGDILCTTLSNYAMPLIRYRVGDIGVLTDEQCCCENNHSLPILSCVEGRSDDVILTRDGRQIGRIDHIFKGVKGVKECQVVQNDYSDFTLNIVKNTDFRAEEAGVILENLRNRVGNDIEISISYLSCIPRTARGKFKGVVREIP